MPAPQARPQAESGEPRLKGAMKLTPPTVGARDSGCAQLAGFAPRPEGF